MSTIAASTTNSAGTLTEAIENLYQVFAPYPLRHSMNNARHCINDDDMAQLHSIPLRNLSADILDRFSLKLMSTWDDANDFRHFLPRLLELVAWESEVDFKGVASNLTICNWLTWPVAEVNAIEQFLRTLWQAILDSTPYWSRRKREVTLVPQLSVDGFLEGIVHLGSVAPYMAYWQNTATLAAFQHLASFVMGEGNGLLMQLNRRQGLSLKEQQELLLLKQPWVRDRLEAAFFDPPDGFTDTELSLIVSRLDWLDMVQVGSEIHGSTSKADAVDN